ncbi:MAG: hypothetical protein BWX88_01978 [Planctomycetes bacterium ADurb.Bin126]|mgnify:FL=1|nr:MAG: hypothetical protein BWX88_01978 [Planctomycetes bacterium ADurb.Bin126]HOD82473.1 hypothetical protein [Phycisphaerae bacterium]HQL72996.1 hypothetical protein [Phycisphaerae bacterium]
MRKTIVAALLCVNLVLLGLLLLLSSPQAVQAQGFGGVDYIMVPGKIRDSVHAVYILDVNSQALVAIYVDKTSKDLTLIAKRNVKGDFQ